MKRLFTLVTCLLATQAFAQTPAAPASSPRALKAVIISMFPPEAAPWIEPFQLKEEIKVPGLSLDHPTIKCNTDDVCLMIAGMGHTNVAASTMALTFDPRFDLRKTYFLIAGISGIDPTRGTTGSA
ncbi:MAG: purine nucleoside permease, partial [Casimicrobium sp.]